jgi:capsular polysaccharide transport system permease protein
MRYQLVPPTRQTPFAIQCNVIGALIMRELHTRFGRDNIGLLWLLIEPMLLASAVTAIHYLAYGRVTNGLSPASFTIVGYGPYMIFRGIVSRSESTIESNLTLLYHHRVTLLDMLVARSGLEFCAVTFAVVFLLAVATACGLANMPVDPLTFLGGMLLLLWFSFSLGLVVAAASERSAVFARLVHPTMYLTMPVSGCFVSLVWLPTKVAVAMSWFPLTGIFEMIRTGEFANYPDRYVDIPYVVAWAMCFMIIGLLSLKVVRRHINLP